MDEPIAIDGLAHALDLGDHELISLVGGGGKTTALFALGGQLDGRIVLTTTTKMGRDRTDRYVPVFPVEDDDLRGALDRDRVVLAWRAAAEHKAVGVDATTCDRWFDLVAHLIVEADGSRRRPFKAPRPYEPVVPSRTTQLVACVGSDALGRVIADQCQRPLRVAAVAGCSPYERLTPPRLAKVLLSDRGSRKDCPSGARFSVLVNQVTDQHREYVEELDVEMGSSTPIVCVRSFES